jgi:hypothetical protein
VVAVNVAEAPAQIVAEFTLTVGSGLTIRDTNVEVTLHVPLLMTQA